MARDEDDPATDDVAVNNAHEYAGKVREYFKEKLERNSIDGRGMEPIMNVNYGIRFMNAF